jgi:hypothetical protein
MVEVEDVIDVSQYNNSKSKVEFVVETTLIGGEKDVRSM